MVHHYVNSRQEDRQLKAILGYLAMHPLKTTKCQLLVTFCISGNITSNYYLPTNDFFFFSTSDQTPAFMHVKRVLGKPL